MKSNWIRQLSNEQIAITQKHPKNMDATKQVVDNELLKINPHYYPIIRLMKESGPFLDGYIINSILYSGIRKIVAIDDRYDLKNKVKEFFDSERGEPAFKIISADPVKKELFELKLQLHDLIVEIDKELTKYTK